MNRIQKVIFLIGLCLGCGSLPAAEYFVATQGDDARDGLSRETSFRTVQKGVDALQPGDTLTILPGEYLENVKRTNLGSPEKDTLIRAALPGTVLLRGDVPAPEFKKVDGYRFVYAAAVDQEAQAVNELDTLTILEKMPDVGILEFIPGTFCYDPTDRKLYISSSDLQAPSRHHYTVSVNPRSGLYLEKPVRVVVEGLAATGFHRASHVGFKFGSDYIWGLALNSPLGCTVRDCTTFLNSGGICLARGSNNVIERCVSFANYSKYAVEGGNIIKISGNHDVIRDCTASRSRQAGIRFYIKLTGPARLDRNLAWGNAGGDLWIKANAAAEFGLARNCVALQKCHVKNITNCVIGGDNQYRWGLTMSSDNIMLKDVGPGSDPGICRSGQHGFSIAGRFPVSRIRTGRRGSGRLPV